MLSLTTTPFYRTLPALTGVSSRILSKSFNQTNFRAFSIENSPLDEKESLKQQIKELNERVVKLEKSVEYYEERTYREDSDGSILNNLLAAGLGAFLVYQLSKKDKKNKVSD